MRIEELDETIKVGAIFKTGNIIPKWFEWQNRKYTVKSVNYTWLDKRGREKMYCFSLTDGTSNFEIAFYLESAAWKIHKICETD